MDECVGGWVDRWMDGSFWDEGTDSGLEKGLIIHVQTSGQIPMLRAPGLDHFREEPSLL